MKKQHIFYNISNHAGSLPADTDKFIDTSKRKFSEMYKVGIDEVYIDSIGVCARNSEGGYLCTLVLTAKETSNSKFKIACKKSWEITKNFIRKGIEFNIRVIKTLKYFITH